MSKKRGALGKGISALFEDEQSGSQNNKKSLAQNSEQKISGKEIIDLDIGALKPGSSQPRGYFSKESLEELSESIKTKGVLQPILVERAGSEFIIIAGERRYRAAIIAGLTKIPAIIGRYAEKERLEIALIENIQREDLNPIEEARAYKKIMETGGISQEEVAARVGKNRSTVANSLRLLKLDKKAQEAIEKAKISAGHARAVLSLSDKEKQNELFLRIINENLSVREAEKQARQMVEEKSKRSPSVRSKKGSDEPFFELRQIEESLIRKLGTKIVIKGNNEQGKLEISYFSASDLERLIEIFQIDS